jgi:hypothetical protein
MSRHVPVQLTTRKQSMGIGLALLIIFTLDCFFIMGIRVADPYFFHHLIVRMCFGCGQQLLENVIEETDDGKATAVPVSATKTNLQNTGTSLHGNIKSRSTTMPERVDHYDV